MTSETCSYLNPRNGFVCADVLGLIRASCRLPIRGERHTPVNAHYALLGHEPGGRGYATPENGFLHHCARTACGEAVWISVCVNHYQRPELFMCVHCTSVRLDLSSFAPCSEKRNTVKLDRDEYCILLPHKELTVDAVPTRMLAVLARQFPHIQWDAQDIWSELQRDVIEQALGTDARVVGLKWFDRLCEPWRHANGFFAPSYCLE